MNHLNAAFFFLFSFEKEEDFPFILFYTLEGICLRSDLVG